MYQLTYNAVPLCNIKYIVVLTICTAYFILCFFHPVDQVIKSSVANQSLKHENDLTYFKDFFEFGAYSVKLRLIEGLGNP